MEGRPVARLPGRCLQSHVDVDDSCVQNGTWTRHRKERAWSGLLFVVCMAL